MKTIKIKGIDYKVKYTIRALFLMEQITGKTFEIKKLLDNYLFFYCMILANNKDKEKILGWDDFLDALDSDPELMKQLTEIQIEEQKKNELLADDKEKEGNTSKKKN